MKTFTRPFGHFLVLALSFGLAPSFAIAEEGADVIEEVVVTGSRIVRPNLVQPTPVTTVGAEEIRASGTSDLGSLLAQFPALGATGTILANADQFDDTITADDGGLSLADLRRLGTSRTLTLIDGKRHVSGSAGTTAVDLNTVPVSLIERVEVLTGGASAIYGSDAVSGVVNLILNDSFEGTSLDIRHGSSTEGSFDDQTQISFVAGKNFDSERGNLTFSYQRTDYGGVAETDLRYAEGEGQVDNPLNTGPADGIPDQFIVPRVWSEFADENGVLFTPGPSAFSSGPSILGSTLVTFDQQGNPMPQTLRENTNSTFFGNFPNGCDYCLKLEDYAEVIPEIEQDAFNLRGHYDFSEAFSVYIDLKYVEYETIQDDQQPSFEVFFPVVAEDNAFIDPALRQVLIDDFGGGTFNMIDFFDDFGGRSTVVDRETTRFVVGFEGTFETGMGDITYDLHYNYGETEIVVEGENFSIDDNLTQALDSVIGLDGNPACRDPSPGVRGNPCVPLNPFGRQNTREAWNFSFTGYEQEQKLEQEVIGLSVVSNTESWFSLPGGGIGWAVGAEWRDEESSSAFDDFLLTGATELAPQPDEEGGFDVFEYFAEVTLPILSEQTFAEELTLDGAIRFADYSHAGHATAWKVGLLWAPVADLRLRGTYSEAVRAPNITEAFLPQTPGFANISDPCDANDIDDDPDRAANCAALGIPPGFIATDNVSIDTISGGNPDLDSEESESFTYGLIFEPSFLEGVAITVDYYDIEIVDAITFVDAQDILDNCVDASGGPDATFCGLITRGADNNIDLVRSTAVNGSALTTKGIDYQLTYNKSLADWTEGTALDFLSGQLTVSLVGNYLKELDEFVFQNRPDEINIERGEIGDPLRQGRLSVFYTQENLRLGWTARHIGNMKRYDRTSDTCEDLSPCQTGTVTYHDLNFDYILPVNPWDATIEIYGGVNNVANEEPPQNFSPATLNGAIFSTGRTWFFGMRGRL